MNQIIEKYINTTIHADAITGLGYLPDGCIQTCVTSPPYWGLRNYGSDPLVWPNPGGQLCKNGKCEWTDTITHKKRGGKGKFITGKGFDGGRLMEVTHGAVCQRCGAWCGELGLEPTPELYIAHLRSIMAEVYRVLRQDGTLWLNLGDSYFGGGGASGHTATTKNFGVNTATYGAVNTSKRKHTALKQKDLVGIPWRMAFAMQGFAVIPMMNIREWSQLLSAAMDKQDWELVQIVHDQINQYDLLQGLQQQGWYLRNAIIWYKPNPMPESVKDRCTSAHEYIFLFSKDKKYYFDSDAIKTEIKDISIDRLSRGVSEDHKYVNGAPGQMRHSMNKPRENVKFGGTKAEAYQRTTYSGNEWNPEAGLTGQGFNGHSGNYDKDGNLIGGGKVNRRDVWEITTKPYTDAHYATFPKDIPELCIKAGCPVGGIVLDPFHGSGTTGTVARSLDRNFIAIEIVADNTLLADKRNWKQNGLFAQGGLISKA